MLKRELVFGNTKIKLEYTGRRAVAKIGDKIIAWRYADDFYEANCKFNELEKELDGDCLGMCIC